MSVLYYFFMDGSLSTIDFILEAMQLNVSQKS